MISRTPHAAVVLQFFRNGPLGSMAGQGKCLSVVVARAAFISQERASESLRGINASLKLCRFSETSEDTTAAFPAATLQSQVQPSAKREGFATVPGVSWSDVGALASVREELSLSILEPIAYPEVIFPLCARPRLLCRVNRAKALEKTRVIRRESETSAVAPVCSVPILFC